MRFSRANHSHTTAQARHVGPRVVRRSWLGPSVVHWSVTRWSVARRSVVRRPPTRLRTLSVIDVEPPTIRQTRASTATRTALLAASTDTRHQCVGPSRVTVVRPVLVQTSQKLQSSTLRSVQLVRAPILRPKRRTSTVHTSQDASCERSAVNSGPNSSQD